MFQDIVCVRKTLTKRTTLFSFIFFTLESLQMDQVISHTAAFLEELASKELSEPVLLKAWTIHNREVAHNFYYVSFLLFYTLVNRIQTRKIKWVVACSW